MIKRNEPGWRLLCPPPTFPRFLSGMCLNPCAGIIVEERLRAWRQLSPALLSFIVVVLVPAAISAIYLIFIASDQFTSETRFAVRPAEQDSSSSQDKEKDKLQNVLAPASSGAGNLPNLASQDAEIVASYIRSPSIINDLSG